MAVSSGEGETPSTQEEHAEVQQPSSNPFDPLVEIVGLNGREGNESGVLQNGTGGVGVSGTAGNGMFARAGVASADASAAERVAAVKASMPGTQSMQQGGYHQQQQQQQQFGVAGTNMHLAANPHLNAYSHAQQMQMQAQWAQQQQAMMQMYSTYNMGGNGGGGAAGYNTMNMGMGGGQQMMYGGMSGYGQQSTQPSQQQQLVVYQQGQQMMQPQQMATQMSGQWGPGGGNQSALVPYGAHTSMTGIGAGTSATSVAPAMKADRVLTPQASDFRVKRGTKPTRVNDDDKAFGPLLDELKARPARSVDK